MNELKKYRIIFWFCTLICTCISPFVVMISSKDISCKTKVACGDNDIANLESCKIVDSKIEGSKFVLIKNLNHIVNVDNPKETALLIKNNI